MVPPLAVPKGPGQLRIDARDPFGMLAHLQLLYDGTGKTAMRAKVTENGHSTATIAGEFARKVGAVALYLNYVTFRFVPALS